MVSVMAYRRRSTDEDKITRLYKDGRGQGHGAEYLPWLTIYDVASRGRSHRVSGRKTGRIHHFLSDIEWRLFLHLDWCDDVTDIREQFPLHRDITRRIAGNLGVRHPTDNATKTPLVMTTDFLFDILRGGKACQEACYVKPSSELENPRVLEKLEIERRFWAEQDIPLRIFTEQEFSQVLTKNLQWLRTLSFDNQSEPWPGFHQEQADAVLRAIPRLSHLPLKEFCICTDQELFLELGSTLALMRHLLTIKAVSADLTVPLNDHRPMEDFKPLTAVMVRRMGAA
jgi:TnsA endonuclease N terminal/TnsA endonuclease C terminal